MTHGTATKPTPSQNRTIILPIGQEDYAQIVSVWKHFRVWIVETTVKTVSVSEDLFAD